MVSKNNDGKNANLVFKKELFYSKAFVLVIKLRVKKLKCFKKWIFLLFYKIVVGKATVAVFRKLFEKIIYKECYSNSNCVEFKAFSKAITI